ncbi:MAG: hypothetical protein ABIR27_08120 [Dokdonella sp.]
MQINGGTIALGTSNVDLGGTLNVGSGQIVGIASLMAQAGAVLAGGSGLIELSDDWSMLGTFDAGTGTVRFIDALTSTSNLRGSNAFHALSLISVIGKHIVLEPGSIQRISQLLEIQGTAAQPIQIERLPGGAVANIDLAPPATQLISHVGVSNVYAIGEPLAPDLSNEGGSGNANGWFGALPEPPLPLPASSPFSLLILFFFMLLAVRFARRRNSIENYRGS